MFEKVDFAFPYEIGYYPSHLDFGIMVIVSFLSQEGCFVHGVRRENQKTQ